MNDYIIVDGISEVQGIINPHTNEIMTVREAIISRILDVRTGRLLTADGSQITINEAAERGLIDPVIASRLQNPCGIIEEERELTLLEAIQRQIYEAEQGFLDPSEKRLKVNSTTINQAIDDGKVDVNAGTYTVETGEVIDLREAYRRGYLLQHTEVKLQTGAVALSDAVNQGLVDEKTGWIVDRNTGNKYQIDAAVKTNVVDGDVREIVDPVRDSKVTVLEAIEKGLINPKLGKYILHHEKLPFLEAKRRQLIVKPKTLSELVDDNLLDDTGKILSSLHQTKLSVLEAVSRGVLDVDQIRCILDFRTNDLITLGDALREGIITPDGHFRNSVTNESITIKEAVHRGYIIAVVKKSIFDVDGFQPPDKTDHISFNTASNKGFISKKSGGSLLTNPKSGKLVPFSEGVKSGLIKPEVHEMLNRGIGIFEGGNELTVLDAVFRGYVDPKNGNLIDIQQGKIVYLNEAIAQHLITPEGAAMLNSLLNLTVSTKITHRLVQRYVTVTKKNIEHQQFTYTEALRQGLIDNEKQIFINPVNNEAIPIVQAISEGLLAPDSEGSDKVFVNITSSHSVPETTSKISQKVTSALERHVYELPKEGWTLADAINKKVFDPVTGMFIIPGTDRLASFEECIAIKIIDPNSAVVVEPNTKRKISLSRSLEKKILDSTGHYIYENKSITMKEAISKSFILLETTVVTVPSNQRSIQVTKIQGKPDKIEISSPSSTRTFETHTQMQVEPSDIAEKDLFQAVQKGEVPVENLTVEVPDSSQKITILEAKQRGIIDKEMNYVDKAGRKIPLMDALKIGAIAVAAVPFAATQVVKIIGKSIIKDPQTGKDIPAEEALKKGLIDEPTYKKLQSQAFIEEARQKQSASAEFTVQEITPQKIINSTVIHITDPTTGDVYTSDEALQKGLVTPKQLSEMMDSRDAPAEVRVQITDSTTGITYDADEAVQRKLITPEQLDEIKKDPNGAIVSSQHAITLTKTSATVSSTLSTTSIVYIKDPKTGVTYTSEEALNKGLVTPEKLKEMTSELVPTNTQPKILSSATIHLDSDEEMSEADKTRARITTEPTYQVKIGRAKSLSPEREAKRVVLQKLRRKLVSPEDAKKRGIIDEETASMLDTFSSPKGDDLTLQEAINSKKVDPTKGKIIDPQRGDQLTINDAINRGILDPDGSNELLFPLNRSLSIPELVKQGLLDPDSHKVVHPETGTCLTLSEAIICDIVDPLSKMTEKSGDKITLEEALENGVIDDDKSTVKTVRGDLDLQEAVKEEIFDSSISKGPENIPPAGMTFPIALKRGLIDTDKKEIMHPLTNERIPLKDAIQEDFIMSLPFPTDPECVNIEDALEKHLIDESNGTFKNSKTGETIPISEALESGLLSIKESTDFVCFDSSQPITTITETNNTIHRVTTRTIELQSGYALLSMNEVQNMETMEKISIEEARRRGIVLNEDEVENTTVIKDKALSFSEALNKGLVDMKSGTFLDPKTGEKVAIKDALQMGSLSATPVTEEVQRTQQETVETSELNIAEAFTTIYDDQTGSFKDPSDPNKKLTFEEAVEKEIIDPNSIIYDVESQKPVTVKNAIKEGLIDPKSGQIVDNKSGKKVNFKEATKIGLIAVLGGVALPLVAVGMAGATAVEGIKKLSSKKEKVSETKTVTVTTTESRVIATAPIETQHTSKVEITMSGKLPPHHQVEQEIIEEQLDETDHAKLEEVPNSVSVEQLKIEEKPRKEFANIEVIAPETTIKEAVATKQIIPRKCKIIFQGEELNYDIQEGLDENFLTPQHKIKVITKNKVNLIDEPVKFTLTISRNITPQYLAELGYYDMRSRHFTDLNGAHITFETLIYDVDLFDPDTILVKDSTKKPPQYITLQEALRRPLIDKTSGHMVDPKTGKRVPFFEAVKLRWIIHIDDKPKAKFQPMSLEEITKTDEFDPINVEIKLHDSNESMPLVKALTANVVDPKTVTIKDPKNMQLIPYYEAVDKSIVDPRRGLVINTATQKTMNFPEAFHRGFVLALPRPISLRAVLHKGMYDEETGKIKDPLTRQLLPIAEAVDRHIIDGRISEVKDVQTNTFIPLNDALKSNLIDDGKLKDTKNNQLIPLNQAAQLNLIQTKPIVFSLLQIILMNYYGPRNGQILNPITGDEITLLQAIEDKLVDTASTRIKDDRRKRIVEVKEAFQTNLIDPTKGVLTNPLLPLDQAYLKGYILSTVLPWSLQETLAQKVYDPQTGKFVVDNAKVTLVEAIEGGIVNPSVLTIKDPRSGDIITLNDAITLRLIDPIRGQAIDPITNTESNLYEAQDRGLVVPYSSQITLPEAVFKGFYDPSTGKFIDPKSKERLKPESAFNRGYVDTSSTLVTIDEELVTFDQAIVEGYIDTSDGVVISSRNEAVDFNEAFERGLLIEVAPPIPLSEAIFKGIYDEQSGLFLDPNTGNYLTLIEAIEINLIDAESISVKDTRAGVWRKLSLIDAIHKNYVDGNSALVKDFSNSEGMEYTLPKAFELGILIDSKAAVSIQRAIHQGLYEENTGKIIDPSNDRKITLHEAIRKCIISPLLPCYFDKKQNSLLNLSDTCKLGVIDKRSGTFNDFVSDRQLKLSQALEEGLIVDIENGNFGLYEAIQMGFYDPVDNVFRHPVSGRKVNLKEACNNEFINPLTSIVKNSLENKYVKLPEAIESNIIDDENNKYVFPNENSLNLADAKKKGLIVPINRPVSLEEAIKCGFYRPDSGKFADPLKNGEFYDLIDAFNQNLIEPATTGLIDNNTTKSLPTAIQEGKIDILKGRVLDSKSKLTYNYEVAFEKGLLVTVIKPLQIKQSISELDRSPTQPRECTLEEAMNFELLDPQVAVTKDIQTGIFKTVNDAISDKTLDITKTLVFEVQTSVVKSRIVIYSETVIIYLQEPLEFRHAVELGNLDINTGKFTDPQSKQVMSLKDSITLGYIDPDSAVIKDTLKKKLMKLPEGFRKGLIDSEKGNILDTSTSKLYSLPSAMESGLLMTPRRGFSLIESVIYSLYNPTTGGFTDPFVHIPIIDRKRIPLTEAISLNLVDPTSTVVKDPESGTIVPLSAAIESGLVDAQEGRILDKNEGKQVDFSKALEKGLILPAEQRVSFMFFYTFVHICNRSLGVSWLEFCF